MSVNYASALSPYEHKGRCGMPEKFEEPDIVAEKANQLAEMIRNSQHFVVITGAGISTSAGIPDFRGPSGNFSTLADHKCCVFALIILQVLCVCGLQINILLPKDVHLSSR